MSIPPQENTPVPIVKTKKESKIVKWLKKIVPSSQKSPKTNAAIFVGLFAVVGAVSILVSFAATPNVALNKTVTVSSTNGTNIGKNAVDGNTATRWTSANTNAQWIIVDLGSSYTVDEVDINWYTAGKSYDIQIADSTTATWTTMKSVTGNTKKGNLVYAGLTGKGRYVRINLLARATTSAYSINELQVHGTPPVVISAEPNLSLNKTATSSSNEAVGLEAPLAIDGISSTRWASAYIDNQWYMIDLGNIYDVNKVILNWEFAAGKDYDIQIGGSTTGPWTTMKSVSGNTTTGAITYSGLTGTGRYLRLNLKTRATPYGFSLWEIETYGNLNAAPPPVVTTQSLTISAPAQGATVSGSVNLVAAYAGPVLNVEFYLGTTKVASGVLSNGVALATLDTTSMPNGTQTLIARAWDSLPGTPFTKTIDSSPIQFTIQNSTITPPITGAPRDPVINVKNFGAKGDGTTDDTSAINAAINSLTSGGTVSFPAGTYRQAGLVDIRINGVNLWTNEGAIIFASTDGADDQNDAIRIYADDNGIYNLNLTDNAVGRGATYEQNRITIFGARTTIKGITMTGSKAAGMMMDGASGYLIENNTLTNTLSDSIHSTGGANNGIVRGNVIRNGGDDCLANVTYGGQSLVNNILYENNECYNGHARHFSVIGGTNITFQNNLSDGSSVAAVMIASEPSYNTEAPSNVKILNNRFKNSNTGVGTTCCSNHGTIHLWSGRAGYYIDNILIAGNIIETQARGPAQIILESSNMTRINVIGNTMTGSKPAFYNIVPSGQFNLKSNTYNGALLPDTITNASIIPAGY